MTDVTDLRQGISPAIHRVLDCLEDIAEGPLGRVTVADLMNEIDLLGETVFAQAGPKGEFSVTAMARDNGMRLAALLLLAFERAVVIQDFADNLPERAVAK